MNLISLEFKRVIKSKIFLGVLLFNIIFYFYVNYNMNNIYPKLQYQFVHFIKFNNVHMGLINIIRVSIMGDFYHLLCFMNN